MSEIFNRIKCPEDIKKFDDEQLNQLADFLRDKIVKTISKTGGHLASSLGTVEITIALHYIFNSPHDKIIWDVGHQCYSHKLLTGRIEEFPTIRKYDGLSGFTKRYESCHDPFGAGHSSTSISAALGFARARDHLKEDYEVIAIIGDGAMTGGMAFEAMNNAGHLKSDLIVVLNDNEMSIAKNVGALAKHLSHLRMEPHFVKLKDSFRSIIKQIPRIGTTMLKKAEEIEEHLTYLVIPGVLFESLGFTYLGPFDGHDIKLLNQTFKRAKNIKGPKLIHLITQKGKGYEPAEKDATKWHGAIPFDIQTGNGTTPLDRDIPQYSDVFCDTLIKLAEEDERIIAITAAMPDGTGLKPFQDKFPDRIYDVGIAEQHAVTFSAGLAAAGMRPCAAIYSTFLQRAFDQVFHDVCLQNLPVVFALDRGGIVGEDGPTHHGLYDLSFLRAIPGIIIMAPKDENELQSMFKSAFDYNCPVAIRYPRGKGVGVRMDPPEEWETLPIGRAEVLHPGFDLAILAVGNMVYPSILAAEKLNNYGIRAYVVNMRFIKPLDKEIVVKLARETKHLVTAEENTLSGGFGSAVLEALTEAEIRDCLVQTIGLPDMFIEHGNMNVLREKYGLTSDGIVNVVKKSMQLAK
ncbi:MAG: 1-deoxy-D-xylulose-5-phosphate synthase [Candidatus Eremiobacteraeota bacterium]|nr:1-deoxy-D-xylulose-5-phosphate synthase [Candidatus Eremiobacteraeota bacterium]